MFFQRQCRPLLDIYLDRYFDRKVHRFCWSKGTSFECAEFMYVKNMETAHVSEDLCPLLKEVVGQIVSLSNFHRVCMRPFGYPKHVNS